MRAGEPGRHVMRWLITGGCGFIGTRLVAALIEDRAHTIRIVDNFCGGARNDLSSVCGFTEIGTADMKPMSRMPAGAVELIEGDTVDGPLAFKACAGADVVVHLAATSATDDLDEPALGCTVNVFGTLNMLEASRHNHVPRFVFASSNGPLGLCELPLHEARATRPVSPHGAGKLAGEAYCSAYFRSFGLETVVLRFGNVYGPGSGHGSGIIAEFIRRAIAGEALEIHGDGQQTRDYVFVDDAVRAIRRAAAAPGIAGETFHIAANTEVSVNTLVETLAPVLAAAGLGAVERRHRPPRAGDIQRSVCDVSKAANLLDWHAQTALADGLQRTVDWFVSRAGPTTRQAAV